MATRMPSGFSRSTKCYTSQHWSILS